MQYHLWKVTYYRDENDPEVLITRELVANYSFMEGIVCCPTNWPNKQCTYARWEPIELDVPAPKQIGNLYGTPLYESGWVLK